MRRAPGEGTVTRRADGRWCAAIQVGGSRRWVYGKTRKEVAEKLQALKQDAAVGRLVSPTAMTVGQFLTDWLEGASTTLRPSTLASYQDLVRCHVVPSIGGIKLQKISPFHLHRTYQQILSKGLSPRRAEMAHRVVHKALGDAVRWRLIGWNVAAEVTPPKGGTGERTVWSPEDAARFIEAATGLHTVHDPLWLFLLGGGVRLGEAFGLRWVDLDLDNGTVRIERAIGFVRNRPVEGPPKTRSGRRTLCLPAFTVEALRAHRARQTGEQTQTVASPQGGDRVFTSATGGYLRQTTLRRAFGAACRRAGTRHIRIHDLRHVHASLSVWSGADPKALQKRLGHASLSMTLGVYSHAVGAADRLLAERLDGLLRPDQ